MARATTDEFADTLFDLRRRLAVLEERDTRREQEAAQRRAENDELQRDLWDARLKLVVVEGRLRDQSERAARDRHRVWQLVYVVVGAAAMFGVFGFFYALLAL